MDKQTPMFLIKLFSRGCRILVFFVKQKRVSKNFKWDTNFGFLSWSCLKTFSRCQKHSVKVVVYNLSSFSKQVFLSFSNMSVYPTIRWYKRTGVRFQLRVTVGSRRYFWDRQLYHHQCYNCLRVFHYFFWRWSYLSIVLLDNFYGNFWYLHLSRFLGL